jgi:hypothetical protein
VLVTEPGLEDTISILRGLKEKYEVRRKEGMREERRAGRPNELLFL